MEEFKEVVVDVSRMEGHGNSLDERQGSRNHILDHTQTHEEDTQADDRYTRGNYLQMEYNHDKTLEQSPDEEGKEEEYNSPERANGYRNSERQKIAEEPFSEDP